MLHIHRAERADGLAAALAGLLSDPLADPLASELVAVATRGMERWLAQQLSAHLGACPGRGDGICAGVAFPAPRRLVADALAAASGVDPEADPWAPERSVWPLLEVVDECLDEPWLRSLAIYLGHGDDGRDPARRARRLSTVRHFAELFDRYARHRPDMINAWAAGENSDGDGEALAPEAHWQGELWRALRRRIGSDGPAQRLAPACARLREDEGLLELPARLSIFGLTRVAVGDLRVLRALAGQRDVHLFLLHPSPALWQALADRDHADACLSDSPRAAVGVRRRHDPTAQIPGHPLLASWGRDAREMQIVLAAGAKHVDHHHRRTLAPETLLERLQAGVVYDQAPPGPPVSATGEPRPPLEPGDRSVQVHACHGRARQVEVLRDVVLHLLAEDPSLEPRDVIVMCPDIETFAPLVHATFAAGETAEAGDAGQPDLRVRLADRSLRQTNPLAAAVAELLELAGQRLTASQVLGFADREPVRRRFGLRDEDLARLQRWIADAGIRWGLDAPHRAPFKLDVLPHGTWEKGLDRLALGVAMTETGSRLFGGALPLDDVDSGAIELAGRLAELVDRLADAVDALGAAQPIEAWAATIATAVDALTAIPSAEAWQRAELQRLLDELVAEAGGRADGRTSALERAEIKALVAERLAGRPTRANFRTGHLTVCTLYPMRSVPHRVVCLLGLDDGAFPRKTPRDGDDLMLAEPRVGERDPRSEDRQLLLDALLATTERLVIFYSGHDERTNLPRPPAVPVGELLDAIDATVTCAGAGARDRVVVSHPLQPFHARNFISGALGAATGPWSFDRAMLAAAHALGGPRAAAAPFLDAPLGPLDAPVIDVEDLVRFVAHPARAFVRQRLRIYLDDVDDEVDDTLPVELDALERWGVGQRLLDAALAGIDGRTACLAEIARGTLPPGNLGEPVVRRLYPIVDAIATQARAVTAGGASRAPIDVRLPLPGGRLLSGTVADVYGDVLLAPTFSRVAPKHRLTAWVRLLAATAAQPDRPLSAATIGRGSGDDDVRLVKIGPLAENAAARRDAALHHLDALLDLYDRGMLEPLPLYCKTSGAYAAAAAAGGDPAAAARQAWESRFNFTGEQGELEHRLVLGGERSFDELLAESPAQDEHGPGWQASESTRFGRLARRLWDALLASEELSTR